MNIQTKYKICEVCSSWIMLTITPNNIHYGRLDCPKCKFVGWAKNPNSNRNKGTKLFRQGNRLTTEKIKEWHNFKKEFCFICLREKKDLGIRETLTADHILELRDTIDGENRDNIKNGQILCSACHKMKLWLTTYLNEHVKGKLKDGD